MPPVLAIVLAALLWSIHPLQAADTSLPNATDMEAIAEAVGDESAPLLGVVYRLRMFALILLGICLSGAALFAAAGRTGLAFGVGLGALVLSGGIWVMTILWQTFGDTPERFPERSGQYADLSGEEGRSGLDRMIRKVGRECVGIMSMSATPFVLIQALWIALGVPVTGLSEDILTRLLLGTFIVFSSTAAGNLLFFSF